MMVWFIVGSCCC